MTSTEEPVVDRLDDHGVRAVSNDVSRASWLVVAGIVLVAAEVRIGGLDLLNAVAGLALIAYAVHRLGRLDPPAPVRTGFRVALVVAVAGLLVVAVSEVVAPLATAAIGPEALVATTGELALLTARVVVEAAVLVALAVAFGRVGRWAALERATRSWRLTLRLLVAVLVPALVGALLLVVLHRRGAVDATGLTWVSTALLGAVYLPIVHGVVSLVRTAREVHAWRRIA